MKMSKQKICAAIKVVNTYRWALFDVSALFASAIIELSVLKQPVP